MTLSKSLLDQVRERAHFACEYCGVKETDSGGALTIDHFQPRSRGGPDDFENLLYETRSQTPFGNALPETPFRECSEPIPLNRSTPIRDHFY